MLMYFVQSEYSHPGINKLNVKNKCQNIKKYPTLVIQPAKYFVVYRGNFLLPCGCPTVIKVCQKATSLYRKIND
jgi:hypothetical protein